MKQDGAEIGIFLSLVSLVSFPGFFWRAGSHGFSSWIDPIRPVSER
jgi:hypothetical protein